jgi:sugar-specific transcriptional regulator TrmB
MKTADSVLTQLGLTDYEARAYKALLGENPATAYEIAKISGIPTSKIYEVISKLEGREMIHAIHGERARMYIPVSPDDFIMGFRSVVNENLQAVETELKDIKTGVDTSYTWHIRDYGSFIIRARRMIETAKESILLLVWAEEMQALLDDVKDAEKRGLDIAVVHYGATGIRLKQVYRHPEADTIYSERGARGFTLIADSREAMTGKIGDKGHTEAIWSMNETFVIIAEDYIRHDIYFMKMAARFYPLLREKFGERFERLRDVYHDTEVEKKED